ncbi:MAG: hypothetical protein A2X12_08645 [Bacteroidetes bacterium GWE2_29_8]|nr:MAG: hypothetical protein A2X12_08645 [Bacteroidetes bacterium GWE2_29_8]
MKKIKLILKYIYLFLLPLFILSSCNNNSNKIDETPTRGNIKISVDDSYKLIIESQVYTFESFYKYAKINAIYKTEAEALNDFLNDSIRTIIVSKKLSKEQEADLKSKQIIVRTTKIAIDAVCFVVNKTNTDTNILYSEIGNIFKGELTNWKSINKNNKLGDINVVFDNNGSSNVSYIQNKFNITKFPNYCFSANSNAEVIDYVESHKNAIGLISASWLSDKHDSTSNNFLSRVKVVGVSSCNAMKEDDPDYSKPYQAYIADGSYPLTRDVYAICRESFAGLGSGFISFIAGDKGQRIILKSGIVPGTMPVRLVQVKR